MAPRRKKQKLDTDVDAVEAALAGISDEFHQPDTNDVDLPTKTTTVKGSRSLFIRSLPESATSEGLATVFSESYPLKHATVVTDKATKKSKGYGFVTFADPEDALKAKEEFDGFVFDGKRIKVEVAEPRHRDAQEEGDKIQTTTSSTRRTNGRPEEPQAAPRLIVRNLPWSIKSTDQLTKLFRSYGTVKQATLPAQKRGLSSGFGFVLLKGRKNAEKAIAGLNGKEIEGRKITVDWALDKTTWETMQAAEKKKLNEDNAGGRLAKDSNGEPEIKDEEDEKDEDIISVDGGVKLDGDQVHEILDASDEDDAKDEDMDDEEDDLEDDDEDEEEEEESEDYSGTLFVRNLPFTATDDSLSEHFKQFGRLRYARVVMDHATDRSRGTAFVCFQKPEDATSCLKRAPKTLNMLQTKDSKKKSVLEDAQADPSGVYTLDGRVLQISRAVDRKEAGKLQAEGQAAREKRDRDKRRLFLLSEGTISSKSPLYNVLSKTEIKMREDSAKQRQTLIKSNPSLHVSLTRLSIRNIPHHVTSKDLKALARQAVVGFATDVKEGKRQVLTKEELSRGGEEMKLAEHERKVKGKGIVSQAKIVFEGREGSKVSEKAGVGKSRGYGFIEYSSHRNALMGLRWLNGHLVPRPSVTDTNSKVAHEKSRRLIVEFAIENAQVVARRQNRQQIEGDSKARGANVTTGTKRKVENEPQDDHDKAEDDKKSPTVQTSITERNLIGKRRAIRKAKRAGK